MRFVCAIYGEGAPSLRSLQGWGGWPRLLNRRYHQYRGGPILRALCEGWAQADRTMAFDFHAAARPAVAFDRQENVYAPLGQLKSRLTHRYSAIQATTIASTTLLAFLLSGCGGGSGASKGGGGGSAPSLSMLAPSAVMVGIPLGQVTVFGQGFTKQSQVLIDGQPASLTTFSDSGTLQAQVDISLSAVTATHQFSV